MERIQQNLIKARADLIDAQKWVHFQRRLGCEAYFPDLWEHIVARRHAAADRVWDLQSMAGVSL